MYVDLSEQEILFKRKDGKTDRENPIVHFSSHSSPRTITSPFMMPANPLLLHPNGSPADSHPSSRSRTPLPQLNLKTRRSPKSFSDVFIGIHLEVNRSKDTGKDEIVWNISVSDGFGITGSENGKREDLDLSPGRNGVEIAVKSLVSRLRAFEKSQGYKIQFVALAAPLPACFAEQEPLFLPSIWQKLDAIPFLIPMPSAMTGQTTNNNTAPNSPLSPTLSFFPPRHNARKKGEKKHIDLSFLPAYSKQRRARGENFAQRAVAEAIKTLSPSVRSATSATNADEMDNEVEVDRDGEIQLAGINDYAATTSEELWITFNALSNHLRGHNIKIAFFSATPQGGGVALMRHALIRLWRLVGLSVHWYTPEGHPAVFDITKRKFHNILQGVNKPGTKLKEEDKTLFEMWTDNNVDTFWSEGAIDDKSIIVIDDPQLVALIPTIKQRNPNAKIIYRSHIQIDTSLVNDPSKGEGAHADVWNYLFQFIEQADVFLAHPVKAFVPQNVLDSKMPVLYMAPSTDPLDGLNKSIGEADMVYYQHYFGRLSEQQCGVSIDWVRPYVVQVARFDPSKGIPDLLEGYRLFRRKLNKAALSPAEQDTPMLIICGHGSVDDPDGEIIFEEIHETLSSKEYQFIKDDVSVVRVPPCDRTLGAILQGAWCATQLSTKEGFEVKVTEAIHKRVPIIASKAGGIPLQVKDGVNGWLVDPGDSEAVSERLLELYRAKRCPLTSIALLEQDGETPNSMADKTVSDYLARQPKISPTGIKDIGTSEDFWSVGNASKWMLLWSRLAGLEVENEADRNVLGRMLPENGAARSDIWKDMEGRDVWEMISGKKDDTLIIG